MATEFKRMQQLRDIAANWAINNPVILDGEITWSSDDGVMKIGDGFTAYNLLPDFNPPASIASINDIGDVVIITPVTTEFLRFNGVNWINSSADLDALSDVDTTGATNGDILQFDGALWKAVIFTGGGANELDDLSDVDLTTPPIVGDHFVFDGANWTAQTAAAISVVDFIPISKPAALEGRLYYDKDVDSLVFFNDDPAVGFEISTDTAVRVRNNTGSTLNKGQIIYISGAIGKEPTVALALADDIDTSVVAGVVISNGIANNTSGYILQHGFLRGFDTNAFLAGDVVYLSATTAGEFVNVKPTSAGDFVVAIGVIIEKNPTQGEIFISTNAGGVNIT